LRATSESLQTHESRIAFFLNTDGMEIPFGTCIGQKDLPICNHKDGIKAAYCRGWDASGASLQRKTNRQENSITTTQETSTSWIMTRNELSL
jgi:hypothetical protein